MQLNLLFVADPLESFKIHKDSTYAMMREASRRGHRISACEPKDLRWLHGEGASAFVRDITLKKDTVGEYLRAGYDWFDAAQEAPNERQARPPEFHAVLMRKDPPFDAEYFYATHMLERMAAEGTRVFNAPRALRDHPEKLAILEFPQFTTPTLVTRDADDVKRFHGAHGDIILKPLDGMGGAGIFRITQDGMNLGAVVETLNRFGAQTVMVQKRIAAIDQGDKRILLIGGVPVPFALARIPQGGEVRGNLAAGGKGVAQALSARDFEIANALGPVLAARGLLLVGLDVIGDCLTEINVTSPTCFQEITDQTGCDVAALFVDALERSVA